VEITSQHPIFPTSEALKCKAIALGRALLSPVPSSQNPQPPHTENNDELPYPYLRFVKWYVALFPQLFHPSVTGLS